MIDKTIKNWVTAIIRKITSFNKRAAPAFPLIKELKVD